MSDDATAVIEQEQVTKLYRQGAVDVHALRGVDLSIASGEFAAISGPSGSGKTTTLNLIGALEARTKVLVKLNVETSVALDKVISLLPSMKAPTVNELHGGAGFAVETVVPKSDINVLIPDLRDAGATDILELPLAKIVH